MFRAIAKNPFSVFCYFSTPSLDTSDVNRCILIRNCFHVHFGVKESEVLELGRRENVSSSVSSVRGKSWSLIWLLLLYLPGIAHGSVHDEIRRGMLYQARSRWKLCFAVCSSVRSGADINLTSYEVCLKSSANASAKQRQMTFAELNSYLAVTFHSVWYLEREIIRVSNENVPLHHGRILSGFASYKHSVGILEIDFMNSALSI